MSTRRYKKTNKSNKSRRRKYGGKSGKKWTTAIESAQKTLKKTGSLNAARNSLRKQALTNAKKLFGSL
jgi:hypothetical protein